MFYHSLISDWNHGSAHFLRGVVSELMSRGHDVRVYEPKNGWSLQNLIAEHGEGQIKQFQKAYPGLKSNFYSLETLDLDEALDGADVVIVHECNSNELIHRIGKHRAKAGGYKLFFHDTHHRSATDPESMAEYGLSNYDGVLAFGEAVRDIYLSNGWHDNVWVWHEAADVKVFHPVERVPRQGDLVWIGNWGDGERTNELREFLVDPVKSLGLRAQAYGVRYPDYGKRMLAEAGITYAGWLPNYEAPTVFGGYRVTVHVPRRPYNEFLPGIPTIRVFEALACGIPLVSAPWDDSEGLFTPGRDYLIASNSSEMKRHLRTLLYDKEAAAEMAAHGLKTIRERHTCAHRVDELLAKISEISRKPPVEDNVSGVAN